MHRPRFVPHSFCIALILLTTAAFADADAPWLQPFTDDTDALLAAAKAAEEPERGVVLLLEDRHLRYDEGGGHTLTRRMIYRLTSEAQVAAWGSVSASWKPWHQDRPQIRARVITADGDVVWLDPNTLGEQPRYEDMPDILSDWRRLRGPLPGVESGAVVEVEVLHRDGKPFFEGGTVDYFPIGYRNPVETARLVIEAPSSLPVHVETEVLEAEPEKSEDGDLVRWTFDFGRLDGIDEAEPNLPGDQPARPAVGIATGASWAAVTARYHTIVEEQIGDIDLGEITSQVLGKKHRKKNGRQEKIAALVRWLHNEVRYTGLEFAEAAIVPRSPGETLERQYGDCKDKSTLLAALLRDAGIPAYLALLKTGPGRDVHPDLPGLGGFDHAILYVPPGEDQGEDEVWIDATAEHTRLGQLPAPVYNRRALVIRPDTEGLTKIPAARSQDSGERVVREIYLAPYGPARVVETVEHRGRQERALRALFSQTDDEDRRTMFERGVKNGYQAASLGEYELTDPRDFDRPLQLTIEAIDADVVRTDLDSVTVPLETGLIAASLVRQLGLTRDDESGEDEDAEDDTDRQADFELFEPYRSEYTLRVIPPLGFRPAELPEGGLYEAGPARIETTVTSSDDAVEVKTVLDTGPSLVSPADYEAMRAGLREFLEEGSLTVEFEQIGETHLSAGRIREALEEFRRLAELESEEALHRTRTARALLNAGLGEAARREARRAVELDPEFDLAYQAEGIILAHDLLGREFTAGMDREGAEKAWRKARELDPDNPIHRRNLAMLLERDAAGVRYSPRAQLDEAIAEYRALREDLETSGVDDNLLGALLYAGRYEECLELAEEIPGRLSRVAIEATAAAALQGFDAGHKITLSLNEEERRQILAASSEHAVRIRRYELAAEFLSAAVRGAPNASSVLGQASVLRKTQRFEDRELDPMDPRALYQRVLRAIALGDSAGLDPIYRLADANNMPRDDIDQGLEAARLALAGSWDDMTPEAGVDLMMAYTELALDGDAETGYRVRVLQGADHDYFYVAAEGDEAPRGDTGGEIPSLRLVAFESFGGLAPIGKEVLRFLDAGQEKAARRWLDWARSDAVSSHGDDPLSGDPIVRFWKRGSDGDAEVMRRAAIALIASGLDAATVLDEIDAYLEAATTDAERQSWHLTKMRALLLAERFEEAAEMARALLEVEPASEVAFQVLLGSLEELERWDEIEAAAQGRLERLPDDAWPLRALASAAEMQDELEKATEYLRELVSSGRASSSDYNNLAWVEVMRGITGQEALDNAQQSVRLSQQGNAANLHTLATVLAEQGETAAAREVILQAMTVSGSEDPKSEDWYVLGRIAEHYGLLDAAAEAYAKVEEPELERLKPISTWILAQRRLAAMKERSTEG